MKGLNMNKEQAKQEVAGMVEFVTNNREWKETRGYAHMRERFDGVLERQWDESKGKKRETIRKFLDNLMLTVDKYREVVETKGKRTEEAIEVWKKRDVALKVLFDDIDAQWREE